MNIPDQTAVLRWVTAMRSASPASPASGAVPAAVLTTSAGFDHPNMPPEVALMLPTNDGPAAFADTLLQAQNRDPAVAAGLFLSDPFLSVERVGRRLRDAGVEWVCNLPSVEQQDEEFTQLLADVGLDRHGEVAALGKFKEAGLKVAAVVSSAAGACDVAGIGADAIIVLPRISEFAAGFPSPRQRGAAAQSVRDAVRDNGWHGPLLGYGDDSETDRESRWHDAVDGILCRPVPATL